MTSRATSVILICFCLLFFLLGYFTIHVNPPFAITTMSRALYVDEGFYSDAAQNFVKFGDWGLAYDLRHWPGAPALTALQTAVFSIFGASLTAARLISVFFGLISFVSLYLIARDRFGDLLSLLFSVAAVITISFTSHSRAAIADPIAVGFSMLAILLYLRLNNKLWAIPLSLLAAYFAFCSKMYFLFTLVTLVMFWIIEIAILPRKKNNKVVKSELYLLLISILFITLSYVLLRFVFEDSFAEFLHINSNKVPILDAMVLSKQFLVSLQHLPFNTKTHVFLICLALIFIFLVLSIFFSRSIEKVVQIASNWGREGWIFSVFLLLGIGTIAALNIPTKAHYFYFSILPICFLAILGLIILLPRKLSLSIISLVLVSHILLQANYYFEWFNRTERQTINDASQSMVSFIGKENPDADQTIAIIGQYASQLGLYSDQLMPLDLRWSTKTQVCSRINYWQPKYLVDFYFPGRGTYSKDILTSCPQITGFQELSRFSVFKQWQDEIVFDRIIYSE